MGGSNAWANFFWNPGANIVEAISPSDNGVSDAEAMAASNIAAQNAKLEAEKTAAAKKKAEEEAAALLAEQEAVADAAAATEAENLRKRRGVASTIKTSSEGILDTAPVMRKEILG